MTEHANTFFSAIPDLRGVTMVRHAGSTPTKARHMHQSLCLGTVLSGTRTILSENQSTTIATGEVIALTPHRVHSCPDTGTSEYIMICIAPECLERFGFDPNAYALSSPRIDDPTLFGHILRLAELAEQPASPLERENALLDMVMAVHNACGIQPKSNTPTSRQVVLAQEHIEAHYADSIRLDTLASMTDLSPWRLNRNFTASIGMPPHEYQNQHRVMAVKRHIAAGTSLAEAAVSAGFSDQSHMTRCFKKIMGMTPGEYMQGVSNKHSH